MKVILSRKGMDSKAGGIPSPILPNGMLLSLPIPDDRSGMQYVDYCHNNKTYREIISELSPRFNFEKKSCCHLDPDIYDEIEGRCDDWKPAFGQCGASATHLDRQGVGEGDIFLFYGMFRQTEEKDGRLSYVKGAPIRHIIYGYLQVGRILAEQAEMAAQYPRHPHSKRENDKNNRLYLPSAGAADGVSCGYGAFGYDEKLVLTRAEQPQGKGYRRRLWSLPEFFASEITISWNGGRTPEVKDGRAEFTAACIGQEFVITALTEEKETQLRAWTEDLIDTGTRAKEKVRL